MIARSSKTCSKSGRFVRRTRTRKFCGAMRPRRAPCRGSARFCSPKMFPGLNDVGAVRHDEILLADKEVFYHGQIVALVVGETQELCRAAAAKVVVEYEPLPPIFTIEEAIDAGQFSHRAELHPARRCLARRCTTAPHKSRGRIFLRRPGSFLSRDATRPGPKRAKTARFSSVRRPSIHRKCSTSSRMCSHLPMHSVVVECPRMGGGFGGKETQAAMLAALAALAATKTGRKVRVRFNRDQDMMITGQTPSVSRRSSKSVSMRTACCSRRRSILFSNGGWSLDLSRAVTDRARLPSR